MSTPADLPWMHCLTEDERRWYLYRQLRHDEAVVRERRTRAAYALADAHLVEESRRFRDLHGQNESAYALALAIALGRDVPESAFGNIRKHSDAHGQKKK
jgi:hypothetical protein